MTEKIDYKKHFKDLYLPPAHPVLIDVPALPFILMKGRGDPNGEAFAQVTQALYSLSYAVKMSRKSADPPAGYYEYAVFPLEGVWDLVDRDKPLSDKSNYQYELMIRQPGFLTPALFDRFLRQTREKKPNDALSSARFEVLTEGLCCQAMHTGPYDGEPETFARMEAFCAGQGCVRAAKTHREIYLSDPRKTSPEKLKTVLRFTVARI